MCVHTSHFVFFIMTVWTSHITWSLSTITATIHGICGHVNFVLRSISYKRTLSLTAHYSFMKECWQCILKKEIKLLSRKNRDAVWSSIKCWHITTSWWTKCPLHTTHSVNNKQTRREHKKNWNTCCQFPAVGKKCDIVKATFVLKVECVKLSEWDAGG